MKADDPRSIKALRRDRGWTQSQLAAKLGTDAVTISRWERGRSRPRRSAVERLRRLVPPEGPARRVPFVHDPSQRLREVDNARREQLAFREAVRIER
jgi:transcriptional regulator with XRE-family HTH domain